MTRKAWTVVATILACGCARPTPEVQFVDDLAGALGGRERLSAARTLVIEGAGTQFNLGQDLTPAATGQTFALTEYVRRVDVAASRVRIEQVRTPNFAYFQGQEPQRQIVGLDGDVAYAVGTNGRATRASAAATADRRIELMLHPLVMGRAMLEPGTKVGAVRVADGEREAEVTLANGTTFVVHLDEATARPTRIATRTSHPNLGDVMLATSFDGYQDVSGLQLPTLLTTRVDDHTTVEIRVRQQRVDGEAVDLAAPAEAASATVPTAAAPVVVVEPVAKGLWLLGGQSHHSVLVAFADHLMLIEAPQSEARTLAVIARARETVPGKPLTHLVASHHHFDHTAGVRAAIAEGLTVLTHSGNRAFFEEVAGRPFTVAPDLLARQPRPLTLDVFDAERAIADTAMSMALYHIAGNPHSETMLMAYFPRERVLVQADAFSPGAAVQPYAVNLLEQIVDRKLRVERLVPLHGPIVPFAELTKTVAARTE